MIDRSWYPRWGLPAVTVLSLVTVCVSTGPVRLVGGLILLGSLVWAGWIALCPRFTAIGPAAGLALAALILTGLVLAALRILDTVPVALALAALTLLTFWVSGRYLAAEVPERGKRAGPAALAGGVIFVAAAIAAVRYSVVSSAADSARGSSLAVWAYSSGGRLHIGARDPAGQRPASLQVAVVRDGITTAVWNDVRLVAGQTWQAPSLPMTGNAPARVLMRQGGVIVGSFPVDPAG